SEESKDVIHKVYNNIYYSAIELSMKLATELGEYNSFQGSLFLQGLFQFDLAEYQLLDSYLD
ncbi:2370_t:CDS:1, partial [Cetraspora pellucida]